MKTTSYPTKQLSVIIAALALAAWGTAVANANLLSNGNMDDISISSQVLATPTGWVATSDNNDGLSSETWNNVADPDGYGVFFKSFHGSETEGFSASLHQDNPATPGLLYELRGWVGAGPGYSGMADPATQTEFALEFLDAGSAVVGGSVLSLGPTELGTVTGLPFDYFEYSTTAVAPAGTTTVRARFSMIDAYAIPDGGDAALVTDAYTLTVVPEPTTFALIGLGLAGLIAIRRRR